MSDFLDTNITIGIWLAWWFGWWALGFIINLLAVLFKD